MKSSLKPKILATATNEIPHQYLSAEKARKILGWRPSYNTDVALEKTINWYTDFLEKSA